MGGSRTVYPAAPDDLAYAELLARGALPPLAGFPTRAELAGLDRRGGVDQRNRWPVRPRLEVPAASLADQPRPGTTLVLAAADGTPAAEVDVADAWQVRDGWYAVGGAVRAVAAPQRRAFEALRLAPAEVRASLPDQPVLAAYVMQPPHHPRLAQLEHHATWLHAHLLLLVPVAAVTLDLAQETTLRSLLAVRERLPPATIVALPMPAPTHDAVSAVLRGRVAQAYGATHLLIDTGAYGGGGPNLVGARELAYDAGLDRWRVAEQIPVSRRRLALPAEEIEAHLADGSPLPDWHTPAELVPELTRAYPPRRERGLVVLCTGLSGAGKSTVARGLCAVLAETSRRKVTFIDGDVARRFLTAGLGFSRSDRDQNVLRVGYVAAEAARHGGLAICSLIAPYEQARQGVRELARSAGAGFVLVYFATPVEICQERDPKGHYARARAGALAALTGVDDPYEVPTDADLVIDTAAAPVGESVEMLASYLSRSGWL